jgi:hypothetical protein
MIYDQDGSISDKARSWWEQEGQNKEWPQNNCAGESSQ